MNAFGKGIMIASAVATMVMSGTLTARAESEKAGGDVVHCTGINACKGQGACAGEGHACKGMNACKGQGWVEASAKECSEKDGKVVKADAEEKE
ncbi:MAG: hypothetical protein AB7G75_34710 [Candidatus Binatia bacterium]